MKKLLSPINSFVFSIFFVSIFSLNASAQETPKTEIKKESSGVQTAPSAPMQTVKSDGSTATAKTETKKKRKRCRDKKGTAHDHQSKDDAQLDSIKAVKNKEKELK
jgi:hypothetical protein